MGQFSMAYIRAVASQVGYLATRPEVDDDSVDGVPMGDVGKRPRLEFQAKATSQQVVHGSEIRFPLPAKNYHDLRADTWVPRILVVLLMPEQDTRWLTQTENELCPHHCAYWLALAGKPAVSNTSSVTVAVPMATQFSTGRLADLMDKVEREGSL